MRNATLFHHPGARANPHAQRQLMIPYAFMVIAWMFDFQSEGAGQGLAIQIFFLLGYAGFFAVFLWLDRAPWIRIAGFAPFVFGTLLYLTVAVTSGLLRGQGLYAVSRHAFTILIYLTATYATARMILTSSVALLRRTLAALCLGFAASAFFIVLLFQGGVDVSTIRYQIQGASSTAALGLIVLALMFRLSRIEIAAALSTVIVLFLTITRSYLVVLAAQSLMLLPAFRQLLRPRLLVILVIGVAMLALLIVLGSESADRWVQRMSAAEQFGGIDPTFLTRKVEWNYMWSEFWSSADKFLFGAGLAAETSYWIPRELGGGNALSSSTGFGHNQYLSLFFTAGAVGTVPLLLVQLLQGWQGFWFLAGKGGRRTGEAGRSDLVFLGAWGATIILGTLAANVLASTFGSRGFSLWYGIGAGLLLGARTQVGQVLKCNI